MAPRGTAPRDARRGAAALIAASLILAGALAGCAPATTAAPSGTPGSTPVASDIPSDSPAPTDTPTASPTPTVTPAAPADVPTDCKKILNQSVLAQLDGVPLNDPATGVAGGVQDDGSLVCLWRDPRADTTYLQTTISRMLRGPALEMMNALADDEGFDCYTPNGGTRCEKTWKNLAYPVTDGRTLFWRDDVMIDTQFSNLAPSGYTDSIIAAIYE